MKAPFLLAAVAVLSASLGAPAVAHSGNGPHIHAGSADVVLGPKYPRPAWAQNIDRSILYPVPKPRPFPWPGPWCLSCPPMDFDERVITPRVMR